MASRGQDTRERILEQAMALASKEGLEGLTIGELASALGLSKSGLFAHFGSKEGLQTAVLQAAVARFENRVIRPALKAPRGLPRIRAMFDNWVDWLGSPAKPGGCVFMAAATELDDKEGKARDYLVDTQRMLQATIAKAARLAIEAGHFRQDLDCEQFAFDVHGVVLALHHGRRLLRDRQALARARTAFERLIANASLHH